MPITVTAVVFQRDDRWIAQCLEYDIVSFAATVDDLRRELLGQLEAVIVLDRKEGLAPFTGFKRAPEKYWRMYEGLKASVKPIAPKVSLAQRVRNWFAPALVEALLIPAQA